jgi:hypothetical protein
MPFFLVQPRLNDLVGGVGVGSSVSTEGLATIKIAVNAWVELVGEV